MSTQRFPDPEEQVSAGAPVEANEADIAEQQMAAALDDGQDTIGASSTEDPALEKEPDEWVSGDDPMTPAQRSYLDTLARAAGEELPANLTKAEASVHIDRLRRQQEA
jgi:hypothetical protein